MLFPDLANGDLKAMFWDRIARRPQGMSGGGAGMAADTGRNGPRQPRIGLALGSGAARGWAHIGVLQALAKADIRADIITGTSMGAVVGGSFAAGKLAELEAWGRSLTKRRMLAFMDFHIGGSGLMAGDKLRNLLARELGETTIEDLPIAFAAVATELGTGHEIWLTGGRLVDAMRASYALPGIFDPVRLSGRILMDGALVNPVPVTVARALGADLVICVNLNGDISARGSTIPAHSAGPDAPLAPELDIQPTGSWLHSITGAAQAMRGLVGRAAPTPHGPGLAGVMMDAFNITQDRISRSRLAGDPPDVMISPRLAKIGLFDFHRAEEAITAGRLATERVIEDVREVVAATVGA
jgi:NTE family protein